MCKTWGRIHNPHVDRHCLESDPEQDLDLDRNQNKIPIRIHFRTGLWTRSNLELCPLLKSWVRFHSFRIKTYNLF
jgi:hypothetical protein